MSYQVDINQGVSEQEIDASWNDVLQEFTFCCTIEADWKEFQYKMRTDFPKNSGYQVWLPDMTVDKRVSIEKVHNRSFFASYQRLLNKRSFKVFDAEGNEVFEGFLQEKNTSERPVEGYHTLNDLMDYLAQNPEKQSGKQGIKYEFDEVREENEAITTVVYQKVESFYKMFLSLQHLYDYIESIKGDKVKLDRIGFRSPGSLTSIKFLVNQAYEKQVEPLNKSVERYLQLYFWFLENEINRCINLFNQISDKFITGINVHKIEQAITDQSDRKYFKTLILKFDYVLIPPKS
jgi:hypothetical protein